MSGRLDVLKQGCLGLRPDKLTPFAHDRLGNGGNAVAPGQIRKTRDFHSIGGDLVASNGKPVGQAHGPGTERSGGRREDLNVDRFGERQKRFEG